ncbi:NACHT domain-containing protein [Brevundimonas diminuta]|uniref:Predicted NTPase (NACHT family) n=1 Tax=Brevundimonas diminuta TaxID=293 RepID=A0A2X1BRU6_BREDI|nr:NACHT domain-containing protein [Brevundimonas diminuta]SPU44361.1 Predicted NTPase (NACHT family) [Brevundimonas diminuta]
MPDPPVVSRKSALPLAQIEWSDFERLCLRLARAEGQAEHWQVYGTPGQAQGGIDIFVRQAGEARYVVWQSKRYTTMTVATIRSAVATFMAGAWAAKSERFVLATTADLTATKLADAVEAARAKLATIGVVFDARDVHRLSEDLKDRPDLVDDFFGRPWVRAFCGSEAAEALGDRLDRSDFASLHLKLAELYRAHFATVDPGLARAIGPAFGAPPVPLALTARYILPDLFSGSAQGEDTRARLSRAALSAYRERPEEGDERPPTPASDTASPPDRIRIALDPWSADIDRAVVIGRPGDGKSTLLRYLALDLLNPTPRLDAMRRRWAGRLPIWVSFPFWTRLIRDQPPEAAGVEACVSAWLKAHMAAEIVPLIQRAFADRRVVLLVDGIDEWSNEAAAGSALALLNTFVASQSVPAIVTSRPNGDRVLRTLDATWRQYELAPLTPAQQTDFATAWLEHLLPDTQSAITKTRQASQRAQALISELGRSAEVATLATVPLMLGGLLALRLTGAGLPRNRYIAYQDLTARVLDSHPQARSQAALASSPSDGLDTTTRRRLLAALAYAIQSSTTPGTSLEAVPNTDAIALCAGELESYWALTPSDANAQARLLIRTSEHAFGILVQKSPTEIGFLHRAFQEYLASEHISGLPLEDQAALFASKGSDPKWRDVLLFVAQAAHREADVATFVAALETAALASASDAGARELLLCDIAFSDVKRSASLSRTLAHRFFDIVEAGDFDSQRREVLAGVIAGLGSGQAATLVKPRLASWFPKCHAYSAADTLRQLVAWPEDEVDEVLWRNLQNDHSDAGRAAAEGLALRYGDDPVWRGRLLGLAARSGRAKAVAAAITALGAGWGDHTDARTAIDAAALSQSLPIVIAGVGARVRCGRATTEDRDRLIAAFKADNWRWNRDLGDVLVAGWTGDPVLKREMIGLDRSLRREDRLEILIGAFPGDDDVAAHLAGTLEPEGVYGFHMLWDVLEKGFKGHPGLVKVLTDRLPTYADDSYALANAAMIARTPVFRAALIELYRSRPYIDFWAVDTLLDVWPGDPVVLSALGNLASWPDEDLAVVADRLPEVEADKGACRDRLLDILKALPELPRGTPGVRVLKGLARTGPVAGDQALIELAMRLDFESDHYNASRNALGVFEQFPDVPEAKALAQRLLGRSNEILAAVALLFKRDPGLRAAVLRVSAPLPDFLRVAAADILKDRAVEDDFALQRLVEARHDASSDVISTAMIAVADARVARADIQQVDLDLLKAELHAVGPRLAGRRLGAVAALGLVHRPDILKAMMAEPSWTAGLMMSLRRDPRLFEGLARAWDQLLEGFGPDAQSILRLDDGPFIEGFQHHWKRFPALRADVWAAIKRQVAQPFPQPVALWLFADETTDLVALRDRCLEIVGRPSDRWAQINAALAAATLLSDRFRDDPVVLSTLTRLAGTEGHDGALAALCDGWPDSPAFQAVFDRLREAPEQARLAPATGMKIVMARSDHGRVIDNLRLAANGMTGEIFDGLPFWTPNAVDRIKRDPAVAEGLLEVLNTDPTASECLTFASLLAAAGGMSPDLAAWCERRIEALDRESVSRTGSDLWLIRTDVSVRERLFDLLRSKS